MTRLIYPWQRSDIVEALDWLASSIPARVPAPTGEWLDLPDAVHILIDDTFWDLHDPEDSLGFTLYDQREVVAVKAVLGPLIALIDELGDRPDLDYLRHDRWPEVTGAATRARDLLTDELHCLLSAYYRPELGSHDPGLWDPMSAYLIEADKENIDALRSRIDQILAPNPSEQRLRCLVGEDVDSDAWITRAGGTHREWLAEVRRRAQVTIEDAVPGLFELGQFLGGHLGQEWASGSACDPWDVLALFLEESGTQKVNSIFRQLEAVLAEDLTETALTALIVEDLGCRYAPEEDGWTYRRWLDSMCWHIRVAQCSGLPLAQLLADLESRAEIVNKGDAPCTGGPALRIVR